MPVEVVYLWDDGVGDGDENVLTLGDVCLMLFVLVPLEMTVGDPVPVYSSIN